MCCCRCRWARSGWDVSSWSSGAGRFCRFTIRSSTKRSGRSSSAAASIRGRRTEMANLPPAKITQDFSHATPAVHHETSDASVGAVFAFGVGLMILGAVILFLVWLLFGYFKGHDAGSGAREFPLAIEQQNRLPPKPRLQTNPRQDLIDMRAKEDATLNT